MKSALGSRIVTVGIVVACMTGLAPVQGCLRDEASEAVICADLASKLCAKWFECWPSISAGLWTDQTGCREAMRDNCSNSEVLYGCDLDNADLLDCDRNVAGSACGSLPQSCRDMVECYY